MFKNTSVAARLNKKKKSVAKVLGWVGFSSALSANHISRISQGFKTKKTINMNIC